MVLASGGTAIDFDQGIFGGVKNVIYFYPDGSAEDVNGNVNNGVVYVAHARIRKYFARDQFWGATGRLRGWHDQLERGKILLEATVKAESNLAFQPLCKQPSKGSV